MINNKIKLTTLILSGIGTIIGSGWLFGAASAVNIAGPSAILSWIIGSFVVLLLALNLIEILTIAPIKRGSIGYFLRYTHGSFASFIAEWTILIGFISSIPSEAIASTQYLSSWNFDWTHSLYNYHTNNITLNGMLIASALCVIYFILNYYSLALLSKSIKWITLFKISVPIITIFCLIITNFQFSNFTYIKDSFTPYGYSAIFSAITTAGIIYAFNGFQAPISFALETENPKKNIPIAIVISILVCTLIYVLLQLAYIGSMPKEILHNTNWHQINSTSPFVFLAISLNLNFLSILLYIDAFISPSGGGILYTALSGRVLSAMDENVPKFITKIDEVTKLPKNSLYIVLLISFICLWLLPSWNQLASVISIGYVLCYATIPISTYSFRRLIPNIGKKNEKVIRINGMKFIAPFSFILSSFLLYWSKWPLNGKVILVIFLGVPMYLYYAYKYKKNIIHEISMALWIFGYLIFIAIFGYLGSADFGGIGFIPTKYCLDHIILSIFSLLFFKWGYSISYKTKFFDDEIIL